MNHLTKRSILAFFVLFLSFTTAAAEEELPVRIKVSDSVHEVVFELNDTPAALSLYNQLPFETTVENYGGNEKIFYPPEKLNEHDAVETGRSAGGLAYFSPWGNVVMYYGAFGEYPGLYVLGESVEGADQIGLLSGSIKVSQAEENSMEECLIPASLGDLYGELHRPDSDGPVPLIILCHGFGGDHRDLCRLLI